MGFKRADRLTAAADLARRCVELGVQPPTRPAPASAPAPEQQAPPPAALHSAASSSQTGRLEALVEQAQRASSALASAVQGQSQQLAVQQQLLTDVVQGLLFVGAKAGSGGRASAGAADGGQARPDAAPPVRTAAGNRLLTPRHTPAAMQRVAAKPQSLPGRDGGRRGSSDDAAPWAGPGSPPAQNDTGGTAVSASPPCGMLRVPVLSAAAGRASARLSSSLSHHEQGSPADTQRLHAAAQGPHSPWPADDRSAAVEALLRSRLGGMGGAGRSSGSSHERQPHSRPAWNDSTVVPAKPQLRHAQKLAAHLPGRRLVGGLGPQLLLQELRRLQRRRTVAGSGGSRQGTQQAPRPLTAPAAAGTAGRAAAAGASGRERQLRAKHSAAGGGRARARAAAPARPLPLPGPMQLQACHRAAAASRAAERCEMSAAVPAASRGHSSKQQLQAQPQQGHGSGAESMGEHALAWEGLTEEDINAACESICRQLLLHECAPCIAAVPG